ncbi:NFYB/HAP3 family transcription factor subunit [Candidatus Woesearchaeota archaeon]|nr:NFYB/HAP3 family transcription factor subunit [Candidatus Woesearchaeota archaeon]
MSTIPAAAMERILRRAGAKRVSEPAKKAFAEILEDYALKIGEKALNIAKNCGRKTILDTDIKMVKLK